MHLKALIIGIQTARIIIQSSSSCLIDYLCEARTQTIPALSADLYSSLIYAVCFLRVLQKLLFLLGGLALELRGAQLKPVLQATRGLCITELARIGMIEGERFL